MTEETMSNPKDVAGAPKPGLSDLPFTSLYEVARAARDGAQKYGSRNWRDEDITASIYLDAAMRHLTAWWEGEELAPDSRIHHLAHACAGLLILLDAGLVGSLIDDRHAALTRKQIDRMLEVRE
jgi:hypothetical protein